MLKSYYSNGLALVTDKEHFKILLVLEASNWMQSLLREMVTKEVKTSGRPTTGFTKRTVVKLVPVAHPRINLHARSKRLPFKSEKFFFRK